MSYFKDYYEKNRERHLLNLSVYKMKRYRPDGYIPRAMSREIRVMTIAMGGDCRIPKHVRKAINHLWELEPEGTIRWQWMHPEESVLMANSIASSSRRFSFKQIQELKKEAGRMT